MRQARRIGGAVGRNTRIVDDLLDGDGCDPVQDREAFFDNYLSAFRYGEAPEPIDTPMEEAAYAAARHLHTVFQEHDPNVLEDMADTLQGMGTMVTDEDKTHVDSYRTYVQAAGGLHGELCAESLQILPDYELTPERRTFANTFGQATQITDDIVDDDVELVDGSLDDELDRVLTDLREYGYTPVNVLTWFEPRHLRYLIRAEEDIRGFYRALPE